MLLTGVFPQRVSKACFVTGRVFTACGKIHSEKQEVSGHDFSRAASTTIQMMGFSPCGNVWLGFCFDRRFLHAWAGQSPSPGREQPPEFSPFDKIPAG
jgi:hypothetical protein